MEVLPEAKSTRGSENPKDAAPGGASGDRGLPAPAPPPSQEITTRRHLPRTRLVGVSGLQAEGGTELARPSIVTRRRAAIRRRRRNRIWIAAALVLGLFPPVWAIYLIAWLVWRSRPPQQSMRRTRRAVRALEKNQTGVALKQLQEAHLLDPSNNDALYWMGLVLNRQHRQEEAAEALSLVAERVPGLPEVEAALVDAYVATGEPESAVYHAQRLLEVAPYVPNTPLKLADAYEAAGKPEMAIEALQQAPLHKRILTGELARIHYRLGTLYERQGDSAGALHHYRRIYAWDAAYEDVRQRMEALGADVDR